MASRQTLRWKSPGTLHRKSPEIFSQRPSLACRGGPQRGRHVVAEGRRELLRPIARDVVVADVQACHRGADTDGGGQLDEAALGVSGVGDGGGGLEHVVPQDDDVGVEELVVRLQSLVRRSSGQGSNVLSAADLKVNILTRDVERAGQEITLTQREFALLEYLMRSPGRVFTRTQIYTHVWGMHFDPGTNLVDVCIRRLRNKVDRDFDPPLIETLRGVGYRFKAV